MCLVTSVISILWDPMDCLPTRLLWPGILLKTRILGGLPFPFQNSVYVDSNERSVAAWTLDIPQLLTIDHLSSDCPNIEGRICPKTPRELGVATLNLFVRFIKVDLSILKMEEDMRY